MSQWINVRSSKPEHTQRVWAAMRPDKRSKKSYKKMDKRGHLRSVNPIFLDTLIYWADERKWTRTDCSPLEQLRVTHWMPLPEPPEVQP